jgi:hypothetical protein
MGSADHLSKHVMNGLCRTYGVTNRINEHSVVESTQLLFGRYRRRLVLKSHSVLEVALVQMCGLAVSRSSCSCVR